MSDLEALRSAIAVELDGWLDPELAEGDGCLSAVFRVVERFVSSLPQDPEDSTTNEDELRADCESLADDVAALRLESAALNVMWTAARADKTALENELRKVAEVWDHSWLSSKECAQEIRAMLPVVESCPPVPTKEPKNA